jgi:mannose-6-phosphate isomerase-like protein (cupin superfamily)
MVELLRVSDFIREGQATRTARYEGEPYDGGASFFFVDNDPGQGVGLHWHPYSETWVVLAGRVLFRLGDASGDDADTEIAELDATTDHVLTVPALRHHGFTNAGDGPLRMMCLHASQRIIQIDLE